MILEDRITRSFVPRDTLNPAFWQNDRLQPEIRKQLLAVAREFAKHCKIEWKEVRDVQLTGSSANYDWSQYSDVDIHLIVSYSDFHSDKDFVKEYFKDKKALWAFKHSIKSKGYEVELYVQDQKEEAVSSGVYSLMEGKWIVEPKKMTVKIAQAQVKRKAEDIIRQARAAIDAGSVEELERIEDKIRKMRQAGLRSEKAEMSIENLAFKYLRRSGEIDKIKKAKVSIEDRELSVESFQVETLSR